MDLGDGLADGGLVDEVLVVDKAGQEGGGADLVDASGQAFGIVEEAGDGIVGEDGTGGVAGDADLVLDVGEGFGQVQGPEMVADGEALGERLVDGQAEGAAEVRVADQQDGGQGGAVPLVARK